MEERFKHIRGGTAAPTKSHILSRRKYIEELGLMSLIELFAEFLEVHTTRKEKLVRKEMMTRGVSIHIYKDRFVLN